MDYQQIKGIRNEIPKKQRGRNKMSVTIYVSEFKHGQEYRKVAMSTSGKWIYDLPDGVEIPEWMGIRYRSMVTEIIPVTIEEFAEFFKIHNTGWVTFHNEIPFIKEYHSYFDEADNLVEEWYNRPISTEEFVDFLRKSSIKELVVYHD